jgi:hypothetical protein
MMVVMEVKRVEVKILKFRWENGVKKNQKKRKQLNRSGGILLNVLDITFIIVEE